MELDRFLRGTQVTFKYKSTDTWNVRSYVRYVVQCYRLQRCRSSNLKSKEGSCEKWDFSCYCGKWNRNHDFGTAISVNKKWYYS
jgi:hypothetical protein